jgi:hypothetical protein
MQIITPELEAILKDHFQAAANGFHARVEIAGASVTPTVEIIQVVTRESAVAAETSIAIAAPDPGDLIIAVIFGRGVPSVASCSDDGSDPTWTEHPDSPLTFSANNMVLAGFEKIAIGDETLIDIVSGASGAACSAAVVVMRGATIADRITNASSAGAGGLMPFTTGPFSGAMPLAIGAVLVHADDFSHDYNGTPDAGITEIFDGTVQNNLYPGYWLGYGEDVDEVSGVWNHWPQAYAALGWGLDVAGVEPDFSVILQPKRISKDKSLRMTADSAEVEFANEDLPLGWGPTSIFPTNCRIRIYEWYGDAANAVQTFTGLIDAVRDSRDFLTTVLTCRDRFALLIDETFSTTAPQTAGEAGAVRTEANGVYLDREVSYIVGRLLDEAGWPTADRAITETSYVLEEFIVGDGASYADTIVGQEQLTGLVGYEAWADELGIFHFAPTATSDSLTEPGVPVYTFRTGEDITDLSDATDQYGLRTRVKIRGPLTTLKDAWTERWRTSKFKKPVGLWYDPGEPLYLRVLDRGTKRMYKLRQSDRVAISSVYLGSVVAHPLGLSGDPSDATIYWVLNCPWIDGGASTGNTLKKIRRSDNHVLASYALPNGRWSAVKVSAAFIWLTNLDTDRFYKRSKVDASAIANYSHTYGAVIQANPSGIMVDGTTLHVFWSNGGTTARFLICDEASPGTVDRAIRTAGTALHGGEMDTTTHTECYGDSDSLGLVAKFSLVEPVSNDVAVEVIDSDLEDELGALAGTEPRTHDAHPGDSAHSFEVRRETIELEVITSLAQATETARRWLDRLAQRRRVLDAGIIGNPALQKTDLVRVEDPVTGIGQSFLIDTYRSVMDGTFVGTLALLPVEGTDDDPTDDGDADEDP